MRRDAWSCPIVCLFACAGLTAPVLAAGPRAAADSIFRSGVELVALNVVVTDPRQQFVRDLTERDFEVLEDGVTQPISFFASGTVPLDVVLLIDTSSSMGSLRPIVQRAARDFLRVLGPDDRAAVVGFSRLVTVLQDLTGDVAALDAAVRRTGASGDTSLYTALYVTLREFGRPVRQATEVRRQAIVLLTDGEENTSAIGIDALEAEARSRGVALYAVMLQQGFVRERERIEGRLTGARAAIRALAVETGAQAFFPDRPEQLPALYARIAAELSNQYSVAYLPHRAGQAHALRRVSVRVATHPALKARTRTGYLPAAASLQAAGTR